MLRTFLDMLSGERTSTKTNESQLILRTLGPSQFTVLSDVTALSVQNTAVADLGRLDDGAFGATGKS